MDGRAGFEMNVLVQEAQLQAARTDHVSTIRRLVTSDQPEDRALTGAVSTHKPYVFSCVHLQRRAAQHVLNAVGLMYF